VVKPVVHYGIKINKSIVLARSPNPREFRILCVARLVPQKDLETLLKGFAAFAKDYKSTRLTIVGKGREEKRLKLISKELGVGELIDWVESSNDVSSLMKRSSCLVLSSKYEGFGLVLLEAMNAGLPIIASKIPTSIEILGEQYPGLFDVGDFEGLSNLLRKFRLLRMRTRSVDLEKKVIADYSIEKCAEETLRVYEASIN
jgi:glycosyltransferase involved in cell wall biosynthesis